MTNANDALCTFWNASFLLSIISCIHDTSRLGIWRDELCCRTARQVGCDWLYIRLGIQCTRYHPDLQFSSSSQMIFFLVDGTCNLVQSAFLIYRFEICTYGSVFQIHIVEKDIRSKGMNAKVRNHNDIILDHCLLKQSQPSVHPPLC
jgi:hypothetical protein